MQDENSILAQERSELITRRLPTFAVGWIGTVVIWMAVFALEGRLTLAAAAAVAAAGAVLAAVVRVARADPTSPRILSMVVATCVGLGLSAIVLVDTVGAYDEILAFLLLTLYLMAAQLFAWGWRAELTLLVTTLLPWLAQIGRLQGFVPLPELAAAITIGAGLAIGVAEAAARNVRQVSRRRRAQREATDALQASRDAYRDLAEKAPDLIWSVDCAGRLTYVNEALARFLGRPITTIVGSSLADVASDHPENPDFAATLALVLSGTTLPPTPVECATPRGPRWVEVIATAVVDEHGAIVGARGISRDIHERKASEEALRTSEARYRGLVESQHELVVRMDASGRFTFVNDAYATKFGMTPQALLGQPFLALVHPEDHGRIAAAMAGMAAPPHRTFIEIRNLTPAGVRWIAWDGVVVVGVDGRIVEAQAVGRDVTERRASEDALRESEERFRSAFDDAAIGMALTTVEGRTLRVNPALCAMLGYTEAELLACTIEDVVHPDDRGPLQIDRSRLAMGRAPSYRAERRYRHRDGRLIWVQVTASMVRDVHGAPLYFLGQIHDITEQHVAQEALRESIVELRRSEEKLRLLAQRQVAIREEERKRVGFDLHDDVCQELVGVGILVESLRRKLAPMSLEHAAEFDRVVGYLGEVIEHLRLLARELRPLLLRDLGLDGSLRSLADGMSSATLAVQTAFATTVPRLDEETEVSVYRIAQEALTNAVRHAGARSVVIELVASPDTLTLAVRDDGHGFDPAARPAVALGLASMEERALALGGRLDISAAPGAGTTVTLVCPLEVRIPGRFREPVAPSPTRSSSRPSAATRPRSAVPD
jgi:PAS domain S-box-containing protein